MDTVSDGFLQKPNDNLMVTIKTKQLRKSHISHIPVIHSDFAFKLHTKLVAYKRLHNHIHLITYLVVVYLGNYEAITYCTNPAQKSVELGRIYSFFSWTRGRSSSPRSTYGQLTTSFQQITCLHSLNIYTHDY